MFLFVFFALDFTIDELIYDAVRKGSEVFPISSSFSVYQFEVVDYERFSELCKPAKPSFDERKFFLIRFMSGKSVDGECFIVNEIGKEMPITFVVCLDGGEMRVRFIDVLAYRETRGGEIRSRLFLKQFFGKSEEDKLMVGDDIRNIRGATLSAWATSRAVRKAFALRRYIMEKGESILRELRTNDIRSEGKASWGKREVPWGEGEVSWGKRECYYVGDTYLCVRVSCENADIIYRKLRVLLEQVSNELSDFYFYGIMSPTVSQIVEKYKNVKIGGFDIFWRGDGKPDIGAVWKGFIVDKVVDVIKLESCFSFEVSFGWSSFYFSYPVYIDTGWKIFEALGGFSVSSSCGDYSFYMINECREVVVLHPSAEFADFASTLCILWDKEKCYNFVREHGGNAFFQENGERGGRK